MQAANYQPVGIEGNKLLVKYRFGMSEVTERTFEKAGKGGGYVSNNEIEITAYDRLLRAWENSMELVRDYEMYSKRIEEENIKQVFKEFAEDEGMHATKLREMLVNYKKQ